MILPYPPYTSRAQNTPRPYSNFFRPYIAFFFQFFSAFCGGCRMQCPWGSFTLLRVCLAGEFRFGIMRGCLNSTLHGEMVGVLFISPSPTSKIPTPKSPNPNP